MSLFSEQNIKNNPSSILIPLQLLILLETYSVVFSAICPCSHPVRHSIFIQPSIGYNVYTLQSVFLVYTPTRPKIVYKLPTHISINKYRKKIVDLKTLSGGS